MFASRFIHGSVVAFAWCALASTASTARADTGDVVGAEALFRSGKDLLARKDYAHACPKLAESYRLDPASGTLLALAICHEREGKLASAFGEYSDVASRSKIESRPDREAAARGKASELEGQVSTLTIVVSDAAAASGIKIRRNGVLLTPAWFGTPVPVDGGTIAIDTVIPGRKPRHLEVAVAPIHDHETVTILPLDDGPSDANHPVSLTTPTAADGNAAPAGPAGGGHPSDATSSGGGGLSGLQVTGIAAGICGALGLGAAAFFGSQAVNKNNSSQSECAGDVCTPAGAQDRSDAVTSGNIATGALIGGGALIGAGALLFLLGRGSHEASPAEPRTSLLRVLPTGGDHGFGGVLQGDF